MSTLPRLVIVRHGDTAWTDSHQHTGRTDIALNAHGEERARALAPVLAGHAFAAVFTSPLQRAARTCALAGFGDRATPDPDLLEWDYGRYEGRTTADIHAESPAWNVFADGGPGGESPAQIGTRADRFVARARGVEGDVLAFSSAHVSRVIAARWLGLAPSEGRLFVCDPASIGVLGYEHDPTEPALRGWNMRRLD